MPDDLHRIHRDVPIRGSAHAVTAMARSDRRYTRRIRAMGIHDHPVAARSPWQERTADRLCSARMPGSPYGVRRGTLASRAKTYVACYNEVRTHLALDRDAPDWRRSEPVGAVVAVAILGGLHHQYVRV